MKLLETWAAEYDVDPYLQHLSISDLGARARYLIENLTTLELNGKIGLRDLRSEPGTTLMRKFAHTHQELTSRRATFEPMFLKGASVPNALRGHETKLQQLNEYALLKKPELIKFGKKTFLQDCNLKVSIASSFLDPSLNASQLDDELEAKYTPSPRDITITAPDGREVHGVRSVEISFRAPRDYYVFCTSLVFDVRLFGDFGADSCLFIYDSQKFSNRLFEGVSKSIETADYGHKPVVYYDPIRPDHNAPLQVEFSKHIKYLYQNEFRHVFIPKIDVELPRDESPRVL